MNADVMDALIHSWGAVRRLASHSNQIKSLVMGQKRDGAGETDASTAETLKGGAKMANGVTLTDEDKVFLFGLLKKLEQTKNVLDCVASTMSFSCREAADFAYGRTRVQECYGALDTYLKRIGGYIDD